MQARDTETTDVVLKRMQVLGYKECRRRIQRPQMLCYKECRWGIQRPQMLC